MRITMRTLSAGPSGTMRVGMTYDVAEAFGNALIAGGYARAEDDATVEDQAAEVAPEPEQVELTPEQEEDITLPRRRRRS